LLRKSDDLVPVTLDPLIDDRFAAVKSHGDPSAAGLGNGNHTSRPQRPRHDPRVGDRRPTGTFEPEQRQVAELKILREAG
jgi:hypothetical protein